MKKIDYNTLGFSVLVLAVSIFAFIRADYNAAIFFMILAVIVAGVSLVIK